MKKIVGILLAFTIILCNSMITRADVTWDGTNYSPFNGNKSNVTAAFTKSNENTMMVTLTWGDLKYKYASNLEWNTSSKAYVPVSGAGSSWQLLNGTGNDMITITNNSNIKIYADVEYKNVSTTGIEGDIEGFFYPFSDYSGTGVKVQTSMEIPTLAETGNTAEDIVLKRYLKLSGKPTSVSTDIVNGLTTVGTVTIKISDISGNQNMGGGSN